MSQELDRVQFLRQDQAAYDIKSTFGNEFTYINEHGNLAIDRRVLREFRTLTKDDVVWDRGERMWRRRASWDEDGRVQG